MTYTMKTYPLAATPEPGERCRIVFVQSKNVCRGEYRGADVYREGTHQILLDGMTIEVTLDTTIFFFLELED